MSERCENCRFWKRDGFGRAIGGQHADGTVSPCVRHSPLDRKPEDHPRATAQWPTTNISDWCGDWKFDGLMEVDGWRRVEYEDAMEAVTGGTACQSSEHAMPETTTKGEQAD